MGETNKNQVIVVGAGASKEFGLPTGAELRPIISEMLNIKYDDIYREVTSGDKKIASALDSLNQNIDLNLHEARKISENMPLAPSIDNFLDTHRQNEVLVKVGKIALVKAISDAESYSKLNIEQKNTGDIPLNMTELSSSWLGKFFTILVAQRNFDEFLEALKKIVFICFNYDRCLEQFLCLASRSYFTLNKDQVLDVLQALKIIHPYGNIGDFNYLKELRTNYGATLGPDNLVEKSNHLRIFTEGVDEGVKVEIHEAFNNANLIMFMGFGFLNLNMELLASKHQYDVQHVIGTSYGISNSSKITLEKS